MTKIRDREQVIEAAARVFAEKGYEKTSIQDILNDLGLSKGGLYHHFKSKEAILDRLNADEWAVIVRLLDKLIERAGSTRRCRAYSFSMERKRSRRRSAPHSAVKR